MSDPGAKPEVLVLNSKQYLLAVHTHLGGVPDGLDTVGGGDLTVCCAGCGG